MGSVVTPCMQSAGALGSVAARRRTLRDLTELVAIARAAGARVLIVDPPPVGGLSVAGDSWLDALTVELHRALRSHRGVAFTDEPRRSLAPDGRFVTTVACGSASDPGCVDGKVTIRDPYFGVHLCPRPYADAAAILRGCPVVSPGATRFGRAIAAAAAR